MSNTTNNNMQTQTSSALHNAIMEADGKDCPPILAPGIDNDIYSTVNACPNAIEMWKSTERLKQGESINVQDLETNLYWEFGKFTSRDGESLESNYSRFYKMMNELVRNKCEVTNHQVNVQFLLQLQPEWQRFVTHVKKSQELKTVSYHKLYDIQKQHQNEVNEIRAKRLARKAIFNSPPPIYDQEPDMVTEDDTLSKEKEIDKHMALISLSFNKIYKPTNNNLRTSSNTSRANQDNNPRTNRGTGYDNQRAVNVVGARENVGTHVVQQSSIQCYNCKELGHVARECQKPKWAKDAAYHKEKMLLCKEEEAGIQLSVEQVDWRDDTHDEPEDQESKAYYLYMAKIREVTLDAAENSGPIFNVEPLQKVQHTDDYNVFAMEIEHLDQPKSVNNTYLADQGDTNITTYSLDKLKCEIDERKNRNKLLETSNQTLVNKLKSEIEDFKNKNKCLESSDNHFKEANTELAKNNQLMFKDLKKFQAELDRYHDVNYASKVEIECCYNDNLALMLAPESDETIRLAQEGRSKLNLKTLLQDKSIAISELKKIIEKLKGNLFSYKERFSKSRSVTRNSLSKDFLKPVTAQILPHNVNTVQKNTNVIALGMYRVHTRPNQTRTTQLPQDIKKNNKRVSFFTRVIPTTSVSRPQIKSTRLEDSALHNNSQGKKQEVEEHRRNFKFSNNKTSVTACNDSLNVKTSNVNFVCVTCGKCVLNDNHDLCVLHYINGVNSRTKKPTDVPISTREPKRTVNQFVATPCTKIVASESTNQKPRNIFSKLYKHVSKTCSWWYPKFTPPGYQWKPKSSTTTVKLNVNLPLRNTSRITNTSESKTIRKSTLSNTSLSSNSFAARTVKFGNDQIALILGYGDLVQRNVTIKRVYYVEGLNHNLLSVGQFCDADLEVAFRKSTYYIRNLKGKDLLIGSRGTDLYSITLQYTSTPNLICLMAKASSSQTWLWHRRLSHLNFDTINLLSKYDIVTGLPKLKFVKDHLCSSCELGKAKHKSFKTKTTPSSKRRLQLLHMDLCGPMRVGSINGKKYVLVIVDDYSRYTWTHFLRSKDKTPEVLNDFLKLVQIGLQAQVRTVRTDKGTKFLNKTLHVCFAKEGIEHQMSIARTPEQNDVVERRNRTPVEAARTMLSAAKVPLFFWAEATTTVCIIQNRSLIIPRHEKTPYHIINGRNPSIKFFYIFGSLCYIVRDGENLDKMKEKGDACIFVGYSTVSRGYRVYNKRARQIVETIHGNFDELPLMTFEHISLNIVPQCQMTFEHNNSNLEPPCQRR
ncbi:retrovirus-related pol polyprotein from transposon TNT 1-94 [Tanacetum coccineum]